MVADEAVSSQVHSAAAAGPPRAPAYKRSYTAYPLFLLTFETPTKRNPKRTTPRGLKTGGETPRCRNCSGATGRGGLQLVSRGKPDQRTATRGRGREGRKGNVRFPLVRISFFPCAKTEQAPTCLEYVLATDQRRAGQNRGGDKPRCDLERKIETNSGSPPRRSCREGRQEKAGLTGFHLPLASIYPLAPPRTKVTIVSYLCYMTVVWARTFFQASVSYILCRFSFFSRMYVRIR